MDVTANRNAFAPETFEEHREYLYAMVRLKLWFVWNWRQAHPQEPFRDVIRNRVDIFRKTDCCLGNPVAADRPDFDVPGWLAMEHEARTIHERRKGDTTAEAFENEAFEVFRASIDRKVPVDFHAKPDFRAFQAGSLRYSGPLAPDPQVVALHVANALRPHSIFDDPRYLPRCLLVVMDKSRAEYGATRLHMGSWLNSHPRWLALFPREWRENMSPENHDIQRHLGYWGQFITARGLFHGGNAAGFRETGRMPFAYRVSECTFEALRSHLIASMETLFNE